jgi:predicted secreted protein
VISEAISQFRRRAAQVAMEFERDGYRVVDINIGSYAAFPVEAQSRGFSAVAAADAITAPTIEAGVQTVSVSVSGTIELDAGP